MSVREYIGARYVPLFADPIEWDSDSQYEPLTVVVYQGNSYTSRQFVPAGIQISNDDYWALTGDYNAQVEQYRAEVAGYSGRIEDVEEAVEQIDAKVDAVEDELEGEIESSAVRINPLSELSSQNQRVVMHSNVFPNAQCHFGLDIKDEDGGKIRETVVYPNMQCFGGVANNSDLCAGITIANSYLLHWDDLFYGHTHNALRFNKEESTFDDPIFENPIQNKVAKPNLEGGTTERMPIDCVTLATLIAMGIKWGASGYSAYSNKFTPSDGIYNMWDDSVKSYFFTREEETEERTDFPAGSIGAGRLGSSRFARYLYDRGMLQYVDPDHYMESLNPGDIIFQAKNYPDPTADLFMGIGHCSMYAGGLDSTDAEKVFVIEAVSYKDKDYAVICRSLAKTVSSNGTPVAKFTPPYNVGKQLISRSITAYHERNRLYKQWDFTEDNFYWEIGNENRYGARVFSIVSPPNTNVPAHIKLINVLPHQASSSFGIEMDYNLTGMRSFVIPAGFDVEISSNSTHKVDIQVQLCNTDNHIIVPSQVVEND